VLISCLFPQAALYTTGDFNWLDITKQSIDASLTQIVQSTTHGRHTLYLFLTNRDDIVSCTVVKSCLNADHLALIVNCVTSGIILSDCDHIKRRQTQFYDIRQCFIDKLGLAVYEFDWSSVTHCLNVTEAYSAFLHNLHCLVEQNIHVPSHQVTLSPTNSPHITPLVKSLLRRRNKLRRKCKTDDANQLSTKNRKFNSRFSCNMW